MPPNSRGSRIALLIGIVAILSLDGIVAYARHTTAKPVSVNDAIQKFREHTGATPTPSPTGSTNRPVGNESGHGAAAVATIAPTTAAPVSSGGRMATPPTPVSTAHSTHPATPRRTPTPTATARTSTATLPPTGVYTYRTHGQERAAIPGGSRNLPDTTTITVEPAECGESEEWDASTEHSESRTLCVTGDSIRLASFTSRIAFYGFGNTDTYTCGTDAVVYSPDAEPGTATTFSCHGDNGTATETLTEVGYQHLTVGGTRVETLHVHVDATLTGDNKGHSSQDLWVTTDNSVLVRTKVSTDATGSGVHYTSAYRLDLTNLTPKR